MLTLDSTKDISKLLNHLEKEGAVVTDKGTTVLIRLKDGSTTTIHRSVSDPRATLNQRALIKRAGHTWPGDRHHRKDIMSKRSKEQNRQLVTAAVEELEQTGQLIKIPTIRYLAPGLTSEGVKHHLTALGYSPDPDSKYDREWRKQWHPEIAAAHGLLQTQLVEEAIASTKLDREGDGQTFSFDEQAEDIAAEIEEIRQQPTEPVDFIDERDSWTVDISTVTDWAVDDLIRVYKAAGLSVEIRIWKNT